MFMETDCIDKKEIKTNLNVKIVRGLEDINKLKKDWEDLFKHADNASPYYSSAWILTFISEKENKGVPTLITVWSDSKLVALLPVTIRNYFGIKTAIGIPSDVLCCTGILADPNYQDEALSAIAQIWVQERIARIFYNKFTSSWDKSTNKLFEELGHHGLVNRRWKRHVCLKGRLEPDFDELLRKTRNKKQRQKLLYHEKQIFKSGDVKLNRYAGKQITDEITARIADIQNNSWVKEEEDAFLIRPLYQKLLFELGQADIGCAWILTTESEDIAFLYGLRVKDNFYIKWMSYKQKYGSSTLSYGKALYTQVIRDACKEGVSVIDFGFGEDRWKQHWATSRDNIKIVISGYGIAGYLAVLVYGVLLKCAKFMWRLYQCINRLRSADKDTE